MRRNRRGSALILVLMMTLAVAGLSIAAIFMSSSAGLLAAFYDREREYRLVAEAGLEMVRSRLTQDSTIAIPDTGFVQLLAGVQVNDAAGSPLTRARVNVYAAMTGDTAGTRLPHLTLIGVAYDVRGTRSVRRMDLQRESFSRYSIFADSFPAVYTFGPGVVPGRVHTNGTWRGSATGNTYRDTVTVVSGVTGTGTFDVDSVVGVPRVPYPKDSTYLRLDTLATAANLSFAPVTGSGIGSRLEFVSFDADDDGTVEKHEGFARVFDLAVGFDTTRLMVAPLDSVALLLFSPTNFHSWSSPIIQNQCGAWYYLTDRWHFFTVASHRATWVRNALITPPAAGRYPTMDSFKMDTVDNYSFASTDSILKIPTARCYPAGSPYLVTSHRKTNEFGAVTGTAADTIPWGVVTPGGGWPAWAPNGYGGMDSTFTIRSRSCDIDLAGTHNGRCSSAVATLGSWRDFPGSTASGISTNVRQTVEHDYLWPLASPYNTASPRGVVSTTGARLYVSGRVRGDVTLRASGRVIIVDELRLHSDPNSPAEAACANQLGIVAVGDILVVEGMTSRVRRLASTNTIFGIAYIPFTNHTSSRLAERGFVTQGALMSLTGTVGVQNASSMRGTSAAQLNCPENASVTTATNGGCLKHTGAAVMRSYSALGLGTYNGFRYQGILDRCQNSTNRPPFFPLTNRYSFVRTLEVEPSQANTPAKIRALLLRLKGKSL